MWIRKKENVSLKSRLFVEIVAEVTKERKMKKKCRSMGVKTSFSMFEEKRKLKK